MAKGGFRGMPGGMNQSAMLKQAQKMQQEMLRMQEEQEAKTFTAKAGGGMVSATVNGKDASMSEGNAIAPLTVINNPGFDLPKTGSYGTWMFTVGGVMLLGAAAFIVLRSRKHNQ